MKYKIENLNNNLKLFENSSNFFDIQFIVNTTNQVQEQLVIDTTNNQKIILNIKPNLQEISTTIFKESLTYFSDETDYYQQLFKSPLLGSQLKTFISDVSMDENALGPIPVYFNFNLNKDKLPFKSYINLKNLPILDIYQDDNFICTTYYLQSTETLIGNLKKGNTLFIREKPQDISPYYIDYTNKYFKIPDNIKTVIIKNKEFLSYPYIKLNGVFTIDTIRSSSFYTTPQILGKTTYIDYTDTATLPYWSYLPANTILTKTVTNLTLPDLSTYSWNESRYNLPLLIEGDSLNITANNSNLYLSVKPKNKALLFKNKALYQQYLNTDFKSIISYLLAQDEDGYYILDDKELLETYSCNKKLIAVSTDTPVVLKSDAEYVKVKNTNNTSISFNNTTNSYNSILKEVYYLSSNEYFTKLTYSPSSFEKTKLFTYKQNLLQTRLACDFIDIYDIETKELLSKAYTQDPYKGNVESALAYKSYLKQKEENSNYSYFTTPTVTLSNREVESGFYVYYNSEGSVSPSESNVSLNVLKSYVSSLFVMSKANTYLNLLSTVKNLKLDISCNPLIVNASLTVLESITTNNDFKKQASYSFSSLSNNTLTFISTQKESVTLSLSKNTLLTLTQNNFTNLKECEKVFNNIILEDDNYIPISSIYPFVTIYNKNKDLLYSPDKNLNLTNRSKDSYGNMYYKNTILELKEDDYFYFNNKTYTTKQFLEDFKDEILYIVNNNIYKIVLKNVNPTVYNFYKLQSYNNTSLAINLNLNTLNTVDGVDVPFYGDSVTNRSVNNFITKKYTPNNDSLITLVGQAPKSYTSMSVKSRTKESFNVTENICAVDVYFKNIKDYWGNDKATYFYNINYLYTPITDKTVTLLSRNNNKTQFIYLNDEIQKDSSWNIYIDGLHAAIIKSDVSYDTVLNNLLSKVFQLTYDNKNKKCIKLNVDYPIQLTVQNDVPLFKDTSDQTNFNSTENTQTFNFG